MKRLWRIDLITQFEQYQAALIDAADRVLRSGRYTLAQETEAFESEFSHAQKVEHTVAVANGTDAIVLALQALGVTAGDEVVTTAFTAVPTIGAILEAGAKPVFADIDPETYLISSDAVASAINKRTKAIVVVHMFGNVVDVAALRKKIRSSIPIIEDAAQAHGSSIDGHPIGRFGDITTFSFYPTKNLGGCGDGGAVCTNNSDFAKHVRTRRNHGMQDKDVWLKPGRNSRMDELQAAFLRVKLEHLEAMNERRREIASVYENALPSNHFIHQKIPDNATSNRHIFQSRFLGDRSDLQTKLEMSNIQTNTYYEIPHHLQPAIKNLGYKEGDLPNTELVCAQGIALPLYPEMHQADVDFVAAEIQRLLQ